MNPIRRDPSVRFIGRQILLAALCWLFVALPVNALDLPSGNEFNIDASGHVGIYKDPSANYDLYEVRSPRVQFRPYRSYRDLTVGGHKTYWLHLKVRNNANMARQFWVELDNPRLTNATLYSVANGAVKIHKIGHRRLDGHEFHRLLTYFPMTLDAATTADIYLRLDDPWAANFPIYLRDSLSHDAFSHFNLLFTGLFYGGLLLMLAWALHLFVALRNRLYLWFVAVTVIGLVNAALYDGIFAVMFSPGVYSTALPVIAPSLFIAATLWYSRQLLWPQPADDLFRNAITAGAGLALLAAAIAMVSTAVAWFAMLTLGLVTFLLLMAACLRKMLSGERTAGYLLAGLALYGLLTAPTVSPWLLHVLPYTTDTLYKLGVLALLFSATLAQGKLLAELNHKLHESIAARTRQQRLTRRAQQLAQFTDWQLRLDHPAVATDLWLERVELCDATGRSYPSGEFFRHVHADDRQALVDALIGVATGNGVLDCCYRFHPDNGETRYLHTRATVEQDPQAEPWLACITHDETAERRGQQLHEQSEAYWQVLADTTFEATMMLRDGRICDGNSTAVTVSGHLRAGLIDTPVELQFPDDPKLAAWLTGDPAHETRQHRTGDTTLVMEVRCKADTADAVEPVPAAIRDNIDDHKPDHDDPLADVANRNLLLERLGHAITSAARVHRLHAVLLIEFDHLRKVNDRYGHEFGHSVLAQVTETMRNATRRENTLARLGGDELVVLLEDIPEPLVAAKVAEQLQAAIHHPISIDGRQVALDASIGIAFFPRDGDSANELLEQAGTAMYEARHTGGNRWQCYDHAMHEHIRKQLQLDRQLQQAMASQKLPLETAAICHFDDGHVLAADPYLRWHDGTTATWTESELFDAAEPLGLTRQLGRYAIGLAVHLAHSEALEATALPVAVHLPAALFSDDDFPAQLHSHIRGHNVQPEQILLCIEQSVLVAREETLYRLQRLRAEGYGLAIDYFGRRHLPLRLLQQVPVDYLRLCPAFAARTLTDAGERAILATVIELARQQEIAVCATGIGTAQQANHFAELGCHCGSGTLYTARIPIDTNATASQEP